MSLLDDIARKLGFARVGQRAPHGFGAAEISRLTESLRKETEFINTVLRYQLRLLRARSRQAAQNNPYARRFAQLVVDNVCGPDPFRMRAKTRFSGNGELDKRTNDTIELAWDNWGKPGNCELSGRWSWGVVQRLLVRTLAIDGELLLRIWRGPQYGPHGMRLQVIDVDRLWEHKNEALPDGGAIHMSIDVDPYGKPRNYWILKRKPAQWQMQGYGYDYDVVPASEIIHIFLPEFAEQHRGTPWMYAALLNLVHLGAFEEAAVIAARMGASAMGFIQSPDAGDLYTGDGKDTKGNPTIKAEPGSFPFLPPGYSIEKWDPKYPDAAIEPFVKSILRGVSAGLGVAYHNLATDLENVNYSSARIGEMDERDAWMSLQNFVSDHLHSRVYAEWLPMAMAFGALPLNPAQTEKFKAVLWRGRRWQWVDPLKEAGAKIESINANIASRTAVIAESGDDIEDVFEEIKAERELAQEMGIQLDTILPKATGVVAGAGTDEGDQVGNQAGGKKASNVVTLAERLARDAAFSRE